MHKVRMSGRWRRWSAALAAVFGVAALAPAQAAPWWNRSGFNQPAFGEVWRASDAAVAAGQVSRSWTWGPTPWFDYHELYRQSPRGLRAVQYFDKTRMEINNPSNSGPRGVTNGLLAVELVGGRLKLGDGVGPEDNVQRQPAELPVAGDPAVVNPDAPTYASFAGVATVDNGYRDPNRTGQGVSGVLDRAGNLTNEPALANDPASTIVAYNTVTGHNIPQVFRNFIDNGPVSGLFAFGYPITDPYWVRARVAGEVRTILVQLYERRVVTYTPSNPADYRVEMGNVGQHYFQWRYPQLGQPWQMSSDSDVHNVPIAFASRRATPDHWETYLMDSSGVTLAQVSEGRAETVPYSWRRTYLDGAAPRLMTDSKREGGRRRLFSIDLNNAADVRGHIHISTSQHYFNPAVSPDGAQIVSAMQDGNFSALVLQPFHRDGAYPAVITPFDSACEYQSPTWLPDGSGIVYAARCGGGKLALYRANIQYNYVSYNDFYAAALVDVRPLTNTPSVDNYFPRISPDGSRIVFSSNRHGAGDIFVINSDGTGERRLTLDPADDGAASWAANGFELVFESNRDGDYEIYRMNVDGALPNATQLTFNSVDDRWPLWFQ